MQNQINTNSSGNPQFGGKCECPDGIVYEVGVVGDDCGELACFGGKSSGCEKLIFEKQGDSVTCSNNIQNKIEPDKFIKDKDHAFELEEGQWMFMEYDNNRNWIESHI